MHANDREDLDAVYAGDIVAGIGLKNTKTGDTLCDPGNPIVLEELDVPRARHPRRRRAQDQGRPGQDVARPSTSLSEEDPTFQVRTDEETGQTVISGMGELHLEVLVDRMLREFKVDATVGKPQVAYRETITQTGREVTYTHKKQTGGSGQYAEVTINLETTGPGGGYEFVDKISGGRIPKEYIPSVDAGIQEAMTSGVLAGYPTVDVRATLIDGKYHDVDSSEMAFKIAGTMALQGGRPQGQAGPPRADHDASRSSRPRTTWATSWATSPPAAGKLGGMEQRGNSQVIRAQVPLSEMFGYATDLRSRTQGRATYTMQFDSYQQMPCERAGRDRHPRPRRVIPSSGPLHHHALHTDSSQHRSPTRASPRRPPPMAREKFERTSPM